VSLASHPTVPPATRWNPCRDPLAPPWYPCFVNEKFRSIGAFRDYERGTLNKEAAESEQEALTPLRVLAAIKRYPNGVGRGELATELGTELGLDSAIVQLVSEGLASFEHSGGKELLRSS